MDADRRRAEARLSGIAAVAAAVARGLAQRPRRLPPWLFYDEEGSRLYEAITQLPEYYLTRAELGIFERHASTLMAAATRGERAIVVELGAGSAAKTQLLVRALAVMQGSTVFVPVDVSASALELARGRFADGDAVTVTPWVATHHEAFERLAEVRGRKVVLFVGSSIGNFDEAESIEWLGELRRALRSGDAFVLGTDLRKDPATMVRAYDDAAGVTAAFNANVLVRINRELGGDFAVDRFRHVALWNEPASRIEMHLESVGDQVVRLRRVQLAVHLADGERIHTESCVKYDAPMVQRLLQAGGFHLERTFLDDQRRFAVHLARVV